MVSGYEPSFIFYGGKRIMKTIKLKKILAIMLIFAMVFSLSACRITFNKNANNGEDPEKALEGIAKANLVPYTLTIDASLLKENPDSITNDAIKDLVPEDGMVMLNGEFVCTAGLSVMDATVIGLKESGLSYDNSQGYMSMLADFSTGDAGDYSGWLVKINGEFPSVGVDQIEISTGDIVEWVFSLDGGADVGAW